MICCSLEAYSEREQVYASEISISGSSPGVTSKRTLGGCRFVQLRGCGMLTFADDEVKGQIQQETGIKPEFTLEAFIVLEEDVLQSIRRIKASPFIPHKYNVWGVIYEVESSRLREVD